MEIRTNNYKLMSRVEVAKASQSHDISYSSTLLSMGSCFSESIGKRLRSIGFGITINPFGTLYNPLSMAKSLHLMADEGFLFSENDLTQVGDYFISLMHHSKYNASSASELLHKINSDLLEGRTALHKCTHLILTFGSSFVYREQTSGEVVANCHKLPPSKFNCQLVSLELLKEIFNEAVQRLLAINPNLVIILTVSPIRYLGYGAHESQLSKARLLLLVEYLTSAFPSHIAYFPAYEIQLDELRDYRFYKEDLTHPSALAEQIIFDRFVATWSSPKEEPIRSLMAKFDSLLRHRSTTPEGEVRHKQQVATWLDTHKETLPTFLLQRASELATERFSP